MMEQLDMFSTEPTEQWVYNTLAGLLQAIIQKNNANKEKLIFKKQKFYSVVRYGPQLSFRICCRSGHHYFGISNAYIRSANETILKNFTTDGASEGFTNVEFNPNTDGVLFFGEFLSAVLDMTIDSIPKQFDCCSRYEECSNAKACIHPNPDIAVTCGYRKILKQGRIFCGENRNID